MPSFKTANVRGLTLLELMITVSIIGFGVVLAVQSLLPQVLRATTLKAYPYARETMVHAAGHHTLHGEWPLEVPNYFDAAATNVDLKPLIAARWPAQAASFPGKRADVTGTIYTQQGSFLVTTNVVRHQQDTIAWFAAGGVTDGLPTPFIWRCEAVDAPQRGGLPDPTTLPADRFPTACQEPGQ